MRMAQQADSIPKVIKRVPVTDPDTKASWNKSQRNSQGAINSPRGMDLISEGSLSLGSQNEIIEKLRQQHRQIVAEGRKRLVGNLVKHSMNEIVNRAKYPFSKGTNALPGLQEDRQALRTIKKLQKMDSPSHQLHSLRQHS